MKRNDFEQLKTTGKAELEAKVTEARAKLASLMFDKHLGKVKNPHEITGLKRDIARMLTLRNTTAK
jgi:ribosomal protein L29